MFCIYIYTRSPKEKTSDAFVLSRCSAFISSVLFSCMNESFVNKVQNRFIKLGINENHILQSNDIYLILLIAIEKNCFSQKCNRITFKILNNSK